MLSDIPSFRCKVQSFEVVEVETYGDRALAVVLGHADVNGKGHPHLEVI